MQKSPFCIILQGVIFYGRIRICPRFKRGPKRGALWATAFPILLLQKRLPAPKPVLNLANANAAAKLQARLYFVQQETRQQALSLKQTELTVEEIKTDNPIFDSANNILKDICNEFKLYNIKALLNGAEVTPNGEIAATFNIPDGYGRDIALYLIKSDGTSEKLDCEISEDGHTLSAKLNELGDYAICKLGDGESTSKTEDDITLEKPEKTTRQFI